MPTFSAGDIVSVPFPYVETSAQERRPALVISAAGVGRENGLLWVLMITSARNAAWPGDIAVQGLTEQTGLRVASVIRSAKIATIEGEAARPIGRVDASILAEVRLVVAANLGLSLG